MYGDSEMEVRKNRGKVVPAVDAGLLYVVPALSQGLAAVVGVMLVEVPAAPAA